MKNSNRNTKSSKKSVEKVSKGFIWSYALSGGGGIMMIQATVASYFSIFMTDTFGIPLKILSIIVFVGSLLDAINTLIIGNIADYTKTRWGRYRPYFIIPPVLLTIVSYFLFLAPKGLSPNQKVIYCVVFYISFQMFTTICTMPQMAILPAFIKSSEGRNKVVIWGTIAISVAFTIATSFYNQLANIFGGLQNLMLVYGVLTIIPFWSLFKFSKEKYLISLGNRSVFTDIKAILKRKELFKIIIVWIMAALGYGVMFSASVYYILYNLARPDLVSSYMLTLSMGATLSMIIAMPICLKIFKTAHKTLIYTQFIAIICYTVLFFLGKNITLLYLLSFVAAFFASMQMGLINMLLNDAIDFIMVKDYLSLNGTLSAIKSFSFKLGGAIGKTMILQILALTGYIAGAVGHQPEITLVGINAMRFMTPVISALVIIICLIRYPIEKYYPEIEEMKVNFNL